MLSKISSFLLISFFISACGVYETKGVDPTSESAGLTADPSTQITYAEVNQLVISTNCLSCHGATNPSGGVDLTSYQLVNSYIVAMKNDIDSKSMPLTGSLSTSQIALFDQWYTQGHLEMGGIASNTPTPTPTPVLTSTVTFAQVNQSVFSTSCLRCHNSSQVDGGVMVDTYAHVSSSLSKITSAINSGAMPQGSSLTSAQKTLFDQWIATGASD